MGPAIPVAPLLGAALLLAASGAAGEEPPSWHAQAVAHSDLGLNVTYFWSRGPQLRAETVIAGHRVVTIVNGEFYYAYDANLREGLAIKRTPAALARDKAERRPFGRELEILIDQGAEKVGEESHRGALCDVYRVTDRHGKREVWVTHDEMRLPVRVELFSRQTGQTRYTDYLNWIGGLPLSQEFFQPEPGIELKTFEFEEYLDVTLNKGPVGPVPVLYADLLHGGDSRAPP